MSAPLIENRTFDELEVGESATLERTLTWPDIELFAVICLQHSGGDLV